MDTKRKKETIKRNSKKWSTIIDFEIFNNVVAAFNDVDVLYDILRVYSKSIKSSGKVHTILKIEIYGRDYNIYMEINLKKLTLLMEH